MPLALIGLGSNLGDRAATLACAVAQLRATSGIQVIAVSAWHATAPVGGPPGQGEFLNGALLLETALTPRDLLNQLLAIEQALGRIRREHWGPRVLDLDLLLYDEQVVDSPALTVPHPLMAERPFVLLPAAEIAPKMLHPRLGKTVGELAALVANS